MEINNTIPSELTDLFIGTDRILSIFLGTTLIWEAALRIWKGRQVWKGKEKWKY